MEQKPNRFLDDFVEFEHFFVRKLMLIRNSCAFAVMPGGFGAIDEGFETATLIQNGKLTDFAVVTMGTSFGDPIRSFLRGKLTEKAMISEHDLDIVKLTDNVDEAVTWILTGMSEKTQSDGIN